MVAEIDRKSSGKTVRSKNKEKFGVPTMSHKIRNDNTENTVQTSKNSTGGVNFITFQHRERAPLNPEPTGASKASTAQRETPKRENTETTVQTKADTLADRMPIGIAARSALALKPRRQAFSGMLQRMPSISILFEF